MRQKLQAPMIVTPFSQFPAEGALTSRLAISICMVIFTPYQYLVRGHIELFEAGALDIRGTAQGRNTKILLGQVGVRCRPCADLPKVSRTRGAAYYSQSIKESYQQNMSKEHLLSNATECQMGFDLRISLKLPGPGAQLRFTDH
jgi:hypothetical protein